MLSVIVPVFNEEESLSVFYDELTKEIQKLDKNYEIIFVDDGSIDRSLEILKKIAKKNKNIKIYSFRKNFGKAEALTLGFQKAKGDYIVTLDADLQDRPTEIQRLLEKIKNGWDLACGWRKERQDSSLKVFPSRIFNLLTSFFWGTRLHDYNCGLKAFKKDAAKSLRLYGGMHRFIPLLIHQEGFKVTEVPVVHSKRLFGKSKYGFSKVWKDLPDIFTMLFLSKYGSRPFHFFGVVGAFLVLIGLTILGYLTYLRILGETIGQRPLLFFGMLLVISGFQVFFTGFLADLIINISSKQQQNFPLKYSSKAL